MALTRATAETILLKRIGTLFTAVGLDGATIGTNADLDDPLGYALAVLGHSVANLASVTTAEVAAASDTAAFLDYAELRALETAYGAALSLVDTTVGPRSEALGQMATRLEARIESKRDQVMRDHGLIGGATLTGGVLTLDFAEED